MDREIKTCDGCEYLISDRVKDQQVPEDSCKHFCGHYDLFEVGVDEPLDGEFEVDNFIGFSVTTPEWCPLKFWEEIDKWFDEKLKGPDKDMMHYVILLWNKETVKWEAVFYCQEYEQFEAMCVKYPEDKGYLHMVDARWCVGHTIAMDIKKKRDAAKAELERIRKNV